MNDDVAQSLLEMTIGGESVAVLLTLLAVLPCLVACNW